MNKYESIFILNPDLSEDDTKGLVERFKSLIEEAGQIETIEEWGKRKLAYEISDQKEGYYVLVNFTAGPQFVGELERNYKIADGVIRYLTIKLDK